MKAKTKDLCFLILLAAISSIQQMEPTPSLGPEEQKIGGVAGLLAIQGISYIIIPPLLSFSEEKSKLLLTIALVAMIIFQLVSSFFAYLATWFILSIKACVSISIAIVNTLSLSLFIIKNPTLKQFSILLVVIRFMRSLGALVQSQISIFGLQLSRILVCVCLLLVLVNLNRLAQQEEQDEHMFYEKLLLTRQSTFELQQSPPRRKLAYCAFVGNCAFLLSLLLSFFGQICYSVPWIFANQAPIELSPAYFTVYICLSGVSSITLPLIWRDRYIHIPFVLNGMLLSLAILFLGPALFFNFQVSSNLYLIICSTLSFVGGLVYICAIPRMIISIQHKYSSDVFKMRWMVCGFYLFMRGLADLMKVMISIFSLPLVSSVLGLSILLVSLALMPVYRKDNFRLEPLMN